MWEHRVGMERPENPVRVREDFALAYRMIGNGPVDRVDGGVWVERRHELGGSAFARFLRGLAGHARLIVTDRRGYACSDRCSPQNVPPIESTVDNLLAVSRLLGEFPTEDRGYVSGRRPCPGAGADRPNARRRLRWGPGLGANRDSAVATLRLPVGRFVSTRWTAQNRAPRQERADEFSQGQRGAVPLASLGGRGAGYLERVATSPPLGAYLNDHLAGSAAAIELIDKLRSTNRDAEFGACLAELQRDVEADRAALEQVMEAVGITRSAMKEAGGWLLEKASKIKFDHRVTGSEHLSRLMETETLALGVEGKLAGWRALKVVPRDLGVDLDALIQRAIDQRRRLEPFRIDAATRAFS
jgi:hypothetical protein